QIDRAANDLATAEIDKAVDRQCGHRFTRATLANDGKSLSGQEVKANPVHDFIGLRIPAKANTQVFYGKQWGGHAALLWVRGSRMSRSASPVRLKPKMPSMMVTAGKIISQGACCIRFLLSANITPSEGVGGWVPRPRND